MIGGNRGGPAVSLLLAASMRPVVAQKGGGGDGDDGGAAGAGEPAAGGVHAAGGPRRRGGPQPADALGRPAEPGGHRGAVLGQVLGAGVGRGAGLPAPGVRDRHPAPPGAAAHAGRARVPGVGRVPAQAWQEVLRLRRHAGRDRGGDRAHVRGRRGLPGGDPPARHLPQRAQHHDGGHARPDEDRRGGAAQVHRERHRGHGPEVRRGQERDHPRGDALRLAREVDPAGERTVGVLTKLDIMDRGTNARDVLEGYAAPLRHGWVAVVNRAQADINSQVTMEQARQSERAFFESKAEYRGLSNCGMAALTSKLTRKLEEAIVRQIPVIQNTINDGVQMIQRELKQYGTNVPDNRGAMVHEVLTLCRAFEQAFGLCLESGEGGGEAVLSIFETDLTQAIQQLPFKDVYSLQNVSRVINEADGYQPHLIAPEMGYRRLIECGLTLLKEPSEGVVDKVYIVLRNLVDKVLSDPENDHISRYGPLKGEICEQAARALEGMRDNSKKMVEMESSYLTAEFFREIIAADASGAAASAAGDAHLKQIAKHVSSYLAVVCNQLKATIPKAIVHCLVVQAKTALLDAFLQEVAGMEDERVRARREMCHKRLEMLTMASKEINIALGKALKTGRGFGGQHGAPPQPV